MTSSGKPLREKDLNTMSGLRKRLVELEMENKRLQALTAETNCRCCVFSVCPDGIFGRCRKQGMRVVAPNDFCSDGKRRIKK